MMIKTTIGLFRHHASVEIDESYSNPIPIKINLSESIRFSRHRITDHR